MDRYLISLLGRLRRSFRVTAGALETFHRNPWYGDLERCRAGYLANRVRVASERVIAAASNAFFAGLAAGEMTETVAQVYAGHPQYRRFARAAARLLDPGLCVEDDSELDASLRRSYELFELYCLYKVATDLQHRLPQAWKSKYAARLTNVLCTPNGGPFWTAVGPSGERRVLYYQQTFSTADREAIAVSAIRRPDFVLADYAADRRLKWWILLDAKYRTARPSIQEALNDMHVYRDSLRWRCPVTGQLKRCEAGYLLVPRVADACREYAVHAYHQRWRFGLLEIDDDPLAVLPEASE